MRHMLIESIKNFCQRLFRAKPHRGRLPTTKPRRLVVSRPASLEERYAPLDYAPLADEIFLRLKKRIYQELDQYARHPQARSVFRESGKLSSGRSYFYLKPMGEIGWLFERDGSGWQVSPAEKDAARNLFIREREILDRTELYLAKDQALMPRIKAPGLGCGTDLLAIPVYEQKILQKLGLIA